MTDLPNSEQEATKQIQYWMDNAESKRVEIERLKGLLKELHDKLWFQGLLNEQLTNYESWQQFAKETGLTKNSEVQKP